VTRRDAALVSAGFLLFALIAGLVGSVAAAVSAVQHATLAQTDTAPADTTCDFASASEGWGLLSADQQRPFAEAPLPVDAAVPHTQAEVTNASAIGRGYLADPGVVGRGQVEAPRPIPPSGEAIYTVPQPLFPASVSVAQPGAARTSTFGFGGAFDPTRQFAFGAGRIEAEASEAPSTASVAAYTEALSFTPGPNELGLAPPADASDGAVTRGVVTVGGVATRSSSTHDPDAGTVRGFASTTISDIEVAGLVRIRSFEVVAEAITGGESPARRGVARVDGFAVAGTEVPFDEQGLAQANAVLAGVGFELLPAVKGESSTNGEELVIVSGLVLRGENVDSSGERRRVNLILGYARASSKCLAVEDFGGDDAPVAAPVPSDFPGDFGVTSPADTSFDATLGNVQPLPPVIDQPAPATPIVQVVSVPTRLAWRWKWSELGIRIWSAGDIFTALGTFGPFALAYFLVRQRRRFAPA
jgi:hypothetical protein